MFGLYLRYNYTKQQTHFKVSTFISFVVMNVLQKSEIEKYYQKVEIVQETAQQIIKDFALFDEKITFSGNAETAYQELFDQIYPIIKRLLNLDSSRFFAMLYAIDVDERKVKSLLFGEHEFSTEEEICKLIIERELIKVVYRKQWSQSGK
ncbi:MAG: hypothetical protein CMC96_09585 [Flavobacteriales bacterium]|nr:hypothetical protein [Flavobacteriales bacterium]|tara:strand:+ start:8686 stop:9135 length:450 start_codon:yes stop_codon:yes gene_type:complete